MSDKKWVAIQEIPGFEDIYQQAAMAQELFTEQELTEYAEEWKQTPAGKKFMEWVSTLEWRIGGDQHADS